jgi:hypothetical protein
LIMQDAKKGVLFLDLPPVLQLQLKRFEYDYMRDTMVKVCSFDYFVVSLPCSISYIIHVHVDLLRSTHCI